MSPFMNALAEARIAPHFPQLGCCADHQDLKAMIAMGGRRYSGPIMDKTGLWRGLSRKVEG
jgi:hypothetical protein